MNKHELDDMEEVIFGNSRSKSYQPDQFILDVPFVESPPPEKLNPRKIGPRPNKKNLQTLTLQLTRDTIWKFRSLYGGSTSETYEDWIKTEVIPAIKKCREMEDTK